MKKRWGKILNVLRNKDVWLAAVALVIVILETLGFSISEGIINGIKQIINLLVTMGFFA
ncbi:hypothetical protein H1R82_07380 [Thermoactinomyces intermedius]|uniref:Uncharacterized protein n=2 Tax=Thermoactinomyces TaxID=2023 RepID=A0A8I1A7A2_THEIN|nr:MULTISPECIES: hypothetical protein [Thermoactinomyces]MBA4547676.1 hypothetical protein [Thermoactinomyces intermedius]MBA4552554.1 hypothetical protein [Thermoactinomyces vulgaris]MBA4836450.1 hypothetical protein [Thermoactinomyces intermedius]MBH8589700.1 hypothetical protein [Thermoactinomyces vulgaris]MBH8594095.1 hypothetical protein [Thermoactinomyces intermedius]